jgi:hypothetical protein
MFPEAFFHFAEGNIFLELFACQSKEWYTDSRGDVTSFETSFALKNIFFGNTQVQNDIAPPVGRQRNVNMWKDSSWVYLKVEFICFRFSLL